MVQSIFLLLLEPQGLALDRLELAQGLVLALNLCNSDLPKTLDIKVRVFPKEPLHSLVSATYRS